MKMMVVGGKRSREFAVSIQSLFSVSTEVLSGANLEDIEHTTVVGNLLERVLILEQAWTLDNLSMDEQEMRKRIELMTKQARSRNGSEQYVFLTRSVESAQMCFEETYDICDRAVVVLYTDKVTVVILHELLCNDIASLRPILVYQPPVTAVVEPYTVSVKLEDVEEVKAQPVLTKEKRIIRKIRGASMQRFIGRSPWYIQNSAEVLTMQNSDLQSMFNPSIQEQTNKGFVDERPLSVNTTIDLSKNLQYMFKQDTNVFAPNVILPTATIPVAPKCAVPNDLSEYIRKKAFKGYVLSFLGVGGSGSTFMALNCAARIYAAGFSVLFIDGDLSGHSAQYLTSLGLKEDILEAELAVRTLRTGFDMYSATQFMIREGKSWVLPNEIAQKYDFIIADVPYTSLKEATDIIKHTTRAAITVDSSNWGIGKAVMLLFNLPVDIAPIIRDRGRLIYNRSDKLSAGLFGVPVTDAIGITKRVEDVFGARAMAYTALSVATIVGSYTAAEEYWYSSKLFSDSVEGGELFSNILCSLLV